MKQKIVTFLCGILFGLGLQISQMVDRDRVLGFLDLAGNWDPTLLFVLGGAVSVTLITFRWVLKLPQPFFSPEFSLPKKKDVDLPLILGSAIFGIGWGIAGYCPGPAINALVLGITNPVIFLAAFIVGSLAWKKLVVHFSPL